METAIMIEDDSKHQWNATVFGISTLRAGVRCAGIVCVGMMLLIVGCFLTVHAFTDQGEPHTVLQIVGPLLLALGGLMVVIPLLTGIIMCIKKKRSSTSYSPNMKGQSAFYKDLVNSQTEDSVTDDPSSMEVQLKTSNYSDNKNGTDALRFLADTVVEERIRTKKNSMIVVGSGSIYNEDFTGSPISSRKISAPQFMNPNLLVASGEINNADGGLECLGLPNPLHTPSRSRSQSFCLPSTDSPTRTRLQRTATYSPNRHHHIKIQSQTMTRSLSRRKKTKEVTEDIVVIHPLPSPSVMDALGLSQSGVDEIGGDGQEHRGGNAAFSEYGKRNSDFPGLETMLPPNALGVASLRRYSKRKKKNHETIERKDSNPSIIHES